MDSNILYKNLLSKSNDTLRQFTKNFPLHKTQFTFSELNARCIEVMYDELRKSGVLRRQQLFDRIPGLQEACKGCWDFYLKPRNASVKQLDIKLGREFEKAFTNFLTHIGIRCRLAEDKPKNYPDTEILDDNMNIVAYCEMKYIAAPFLFAYKKMPGRECYEGSNTLDVGKKIAAQRQLIEKEIKVPVFYVYWLDYPCVKGIFFMTAKEVFDYIDNVGIEYQRKERSGDFVHSRDGEKIKVATLEKVYLPLHRMHKFDELINQFCNLAGG